MALVTDPATGIVYDDSQLSAPVAVNWQQPANARGFADTLAALPAFQWNGSIDAFQTWAESIDVAQVSSGLPRPDFFHWLSVYRPDIIQGLSDSGLQSFLASQPQLAWWEKYLPEIIGGGGLLASYIWPAAFGELGAAGAAGVAGGAATGTAAVGGGAAAIGAAGAAPSLTALVAALVGPTAAIVHAATTHPTTTTPTTTTTADQLPFMLAPTEWLALAVLAIVLFSTHRH